MYKMSQSKPPGHTIYRVHARACVRCPRHGTLCRTKRPSIVDSREDHLLNRVKTYTETDTAKKTFRRRKWQVEPAFGELKTSRGMRQATLRGSWKVQIQALTAFAAYNIKRLVKAATLGTKGAREVLSTAACSLLKLRLPVPLPWSLHSAGFLLTTLEFGNSLITENTMSMTHGEKGTDVALAVDALRVGSALNSE